MKLADFIQVRKDWRGWKGCVAGWAKSLDDFPLICASGKTRGEALLALIEKITAFLEQAQYSPVLITARPGIQGLIWPTPDGWASCIYRDGKTGGTAFYRDRVQAEHSTRLFLAQIIYEMSDGVDEGMDIVTGGDLPWQHARWVTWQNTYRKAAQDGFSPAECRALANKT